MKNKAFKLAFIIVIAGVLVFGASFAKAETTQTNEGIIKILQNLIRTLIQMINQLFQQLAQRITTPSITTELGGEDATANWKTYRNEEYGVRFEYPKDWEITDDSSGFQSAACQDPEWQIKNPEECKKVFSIGLGKDGETLLSINTRQCNNMVSLGFADYYICLDVSLTSEQIYEPPFGDEKLKYLDSEVRNAFNKIKDSFFIIPNAPTLSYLKGVSPFVQINWNYGIADYFNIYRASSLEGPWKKIIELFPQSAHTAVDYHLPEGGKILYYKITSVDKKGNESKYSEISSVKITEQVIRKRIDEFMGLRAKRDAEKAIVYLTEKAILGLGGESEAKNYLIGLTNPHIYKYEITSITEIPKGTLGYPGGGYKVIIKGYEEYTGEGEVGSFVEGLNLIEANNQWFINEVIEKRYD